MNEISTCSYYTCVGYFADMLKLFCEEDAVKKLCPTAKIKPSDLRDDIPDEVIELDLLQLKTFFSRDSWLLVNRKGEFSLIWYQ